LELLIPIWFTNLFLMLDGQRPIVQQLFFSAIPKTKSRSIQYGAALKCFAASATAKGAVSAHGQ
jgi:hypothetical protein